MARKELALRIGLALQGSRIPPDGDMRWRRIRRFNRAEFALRFVSRPEWGVRWG